MLRSNNEKRGKLDNIGLSSSKHSSYRGMSSGRMWRKCGATKTPSVRDTLRNELALNDGDTSSENFQNALKAFIDKVAQDNVKQKRRCFAVGHVDDDVGHSYSVEEGIWLMLTKPNFYGNIGFNKNGDPLYTLGRMSFGIFSPTGLVCSLQSNINQMELLGYDERQVMLESGLVPKALRPEVENMDTLLRTYNVITFFTIEALQSEPVEIFMFPNNTLNRDILQPIHGIMSTYGFTIPDPTVPNRYSVWFTGGKIEPNSSEGDIHEWNRFFTLHPPRHTFWEQLKLLPIKLWMGVSVSSKVNVDDHGSFTYSFTSPLGGHGVAYIDVQYVDDTFRIVRGHRGTTFLFSRMEKERQQEHQKNL